MSNDVHVSNKVSNRLLPEDVELMFKPHRCSMDGVIKINAINDAAIAFVKAIQTACPTCVDAQQAIKAVREAKMWATAAISLDESNWEKE